MHDDRRTSEENPEFGPPHDGDSEADNNKDDTLGVKLGRVGRPPFIRPHAIKLEKNEHRKYVQDGYEYKGLAINGLMTASQVQILFSGVLEEDLDN